MRVYRLALGLLALGLAASAYLLMRTFALLGDWAPDKIDVCSAVFGFGCDATLLSPSSWVLGVPLAGWGIMYFGTLTLLLVLGRGMGESFRGPAHLAATGLAAAGVVVSLYLLVLFATGRVPVCPVCVLVHGLNLLLFPSLYHIDARSWSARRAAAGRGFAWLLGRRQDELARWQTLGFVCVALAAFAMWQWVLVQSELRLAVAEGAVVPAQVIDQFHREGVRDVPVYPGDPRLGPADAPVTLVVFSSFQCPGCRSFAEKIVRLTTRNEGRLAIVFKHYPLGSDCNPGVKVDKHPRACAAALAAEGARAQGAFWPYHDALFAGNLGQSEAQLRRAATGAGLDLAAWERDRESLAASGRVARDVGDGADLGVDATPTVFLNGRRVRSLSLRAIEVLIEHEVAGDHAGHDHAH